MRRSVRRLSIPITLLVLFVSTSGCGAKLVPPPPSSITTPQATTAYYGTRVIRALDLIRDTANDAYHNRPQVITADTLKTIVEWHKSTITIVHQAQFGWQRGVIAALDDLKHRLQGDDQAVLATYIGFAEAILKEVRIP